MSTKPKPDPSTRLAKVISMLWQNRVTVAAAFVALTGWGIWAWGKYTASATSAATAVDTRSAARENAMEKRLSDDFHQGIQGVERKVDVQGAKIDLLVQVITGRDPKTIATSDRP